MPWIEISLDEEFVLDEVRFDGVRLGLGANGGFFHATTLLKPCRGHHGEAGNGRA